MINFEARDVYYKKRKNMRNIIDLKRMEAYKELKISSKV